jgi:hypothetical protein
MSLIEQLEEFTKGDQQSLTFPAFTTKAERLMIHEFCSANNLHSFSVGEEPNRFLTVSKNVVGLGYSQSTIKKFIKDFNLPIAVSMEPYFSYFIEQYDELFDTKYKLSLFSKVVDAAINTSFDEYYNRVFFSIVDAIKASPVYKSIQDDRTKYPASMFIMPDNINIYNHDDKTWPKYYVSLDLIKANFTCMKYIDPELVLGAESWETFVAKFTPLKYFAEAKYFRQHVLGHLNMRKVVTIQKILLSELYKMVSSSSVTVAGKVGDDELLIRSSKEQLAADCRVLTGLVSSLPEQSRSVWRISLFSIEPIGKTGGFVRKTYLNNQSEYTVELKNIRKEIFAQVYKMYRNEPIVEDDLRFMAAGCVARFETPICL